MAKESSKNFVYIAIRKENWENLISKKGDDILEYKDLKEFLNRARLAYQNRNVNKTNSNHYANEAKKWIAYNKAIKAIEKMLYLKTDITAYKLSKESGINYRTAKKFIEEYKSYLNIEDYKLAKKEIEENAEIYVKDKSKL
jgi:hypothetical protein